MSVSFDLFIILFSFSHIGLSEDIRVVFGTQELEDDKTLGFYEITQSSVLIFVMIIRGGGGPGMIYVLICIILFRY